MYMPLKEGQGEWRRSKEKKLGIREEQRNANKGRGMQIREEGDEDSGREEGWPLLFL